MKWIQTCKTYLNNIIAAEISTFSQYYDKLVQWNVLPHDSGALWEKIICPLKEKALPDTALPDLKGDAQQRIMVLLNGCLNHDLDIQKTFITLKSQLSRNSRLVLVTYNPYLSWLYRIASYLKIRQGEQPVTFLTRTDLKNLAQISGYDVVRIRPVAYFPFKLLGFGNLLNQILPMTPIVRWLGIVNVITLRPIIPEAQKPSLSILIPARNEKGNIENALKRLPNLEGVDMEIIFVEGHSTDGTWEEIQRVSNEYGKHYKIITCQQTGKGKGDAVRLGLSKAQGDLLTILDADLTMPPEMLGRFYEAYCQGNADFVNGSRLVYPMEGEAMRFLNQLGNIFFAKALSLTLGVQLGDSLCGTKLFTRHDYQRMIQWRKDFGDFDPFGDFEILFPAAIFGLGIVDIPIRYRSRTYGSTNISRFRHGLMLLKMTFIGLLRVTPGKTKTITKKGL